MSIFDAFIDSRFVRHFSRCGLSAALDFSRRSCCRVDKYNGVAKRPDDRAGRSEDFAAVPRPVASHLVLRHREPIGRFVFLTNNFTLPGTDDRSALQIRSQVELFFKWIKQHLRIKSFYGTSNNTVKTQVWIAISVYVLVAIIKKELGMERSLSEILQILSLGLFDKTPYFSGIERAKDAISKY